MAFVPAENCFMVELRGIFLNRKFENTLYFRVNEGLMSNEIITNEAFLRTVFLPAIKALLSADLAYTEIYYTVLSNQTAPTYSFPLNPWLYGGDANPAMPGSIAACISFKGAGRGKWTRGRNYLTGLTEVKVSNNTLDGSFLTSAVNAYEKLRTDAGRPENQEWVIISRYLDGVPRSSALITPVSAVMSTSARVDSMRRRTGRA